MFSWLTDENGQGMVEYALILGLIALAVIGALVLLGPRVSSLYQQVNDAIPEGNA
ncbi:MAG: Flp family type IVb pilin [Acutalibacteraceae bacterium]